MTNKILYAVFSIVLLSSCVTTRRINYLQEKAGKIPDSLLTDTLPDYILRVGDKLAVNLITLDQESKSLFMSGTSSTENVVTDLSFYSILPDGNIQFPFVGKIYLLGLTTRQAKDTVEKHLKKIIPDCEVEVSLVNSYFTIIGLAGTGKYALRNEKMNIFQALATSGNLQSFSDRTKIHLLRQDEKGKTQIKTFDIRNKQIMNSEFYYLQPNDILYVQAFNGQFFGVESFSSIFSTVTSTFSLAYLIYYYTGSLSK
ncbi:MAG: polysaccharide biosynthesis/export family protein [Paludibacteraceae bacterium]|nr:polysaccharide biosynthesis/export family protein [Paludibacteraceae bacterium]